MHEPRAKAGKRKAIFLDRDGTLIVDKHYLSDPAGVELLPGVPAALRLLRDSGFDLYLFTNQSGIGRGMYSLEDAVRCNQRMEELIGLPRPLFKATCIAPEAPDQPQEYRKPSPRFILESIANHALDPAQCWMVGDNQADIEAGRAAGVTVAGVCTGKLSPEKFVSLGVPRAWVFGTLVDFATALANRRV